MKTPVETIDMTPTWRGILPVLLLGLDAETSEARQIATEELQRMASLADEAVASRDSYSKSDGQPSAAALAYAPGAPA